MGFEFEAFGMDGFGANEWGVEAFEFGEIDQDDLEFWGVQTDAVELDLVGEADESVMDLMELAEEPLSLRPWVDRFDQLEMRERPVDAAIAVFELLQAIASVEDRALLMTSLMQPAWWVAIYTIRAWEQRWDGEYFAVQLREALAEVAIVQRWLGFAASNGLMAAEVHRELVQRYRGIEASLSQLVALADCRILQDQRFQEV